MRRPNRWGRGSRKWAAVVRAGTAGMRSTTAAGQVRRASCLGIRGNSHMIMQDRNNLQIANLILTWMGRHTRGGSARREQVRVTRRRRRLTMKFTLKHRLEFLVRMLSLFVSMLTLLPLLAAAQTRPDDALRARTQRLEDQAALKHLVDTFSNLADVKDIDRQVLLFTEDATVESRTGDAPGNPLKGRKQIGETFRAFLAGFETVYHINGQQTVSIQGDKATGTAYCL